MNGAAGVFAPWVIFGDDVGALGNSANEGEVITAGATDADKGLANLDVVIVLLGVGF